jgi:hypothetical protein
MTTTMPPQDLTHASALRWLIDAYFAVQKARIASTNRVGAVERDVDLGPVPIVLSELGPRLLEIENELADTAGTMLDAHPAWHWLKLWRHAGYAVLDGKAERPVKGERRHYDLRLKTTVYLAVKSFIMSGAASPYEEVYRRAREKYDRRIAPCADPAHAGFPKASYKCPDCWPALRAERAAYRVVAHLFLSHLWETWRVAEGLPVRRPYALEKLGHTTYSDPWDFVGKREPPAE